MSDNIKDCVAYFKSRPEYRRLMENMLKNYRSYGKASGNVIIKDASVSECFAASEIIMPKRPYLPPVLKFRLKDFEAGLSLTKFKNITLKNLLEAYFQTEIIGNEQLKLTEKERKEQFWEKIFLRNKTAAGNEWLAEMYKNQNFGYRAVINEYNNSVETAEKIVNNICDALQFCIESNSYIQLAVLSAKITGNPHYFDKTFAAGRLFLQSMSFISGIELTGAAEQEKEIYDYFNIEPDNISGSAAVIGLHLYLNDNTEHPGYKYFADSGEMFLLSVSGLSNISSADSADKEVFIVENPMVFSALSEAAAKNKKCLICTFGQIKHSGLKLVDMLTDNDCKIFYSGDFDPEGLQIADKLISRNKNIQSWHMSRQDYISIEKSEPISERRLKILENISDSTLKETAEEIKKTGKSAYQELLIDIIVENWQ